MENIVINVDFQSKDLSSIFANEVQVVPGDIAWEDLELMLKVYSDHESVKVYYADDDDDLVIIGSQEELEEAFKVARKCNNTLKLTVVCDDRLCPPDAFDLDRDMAVFPADAQFLDLFTGEHPSFLHQPPSYGDLQMLPRGFGGGCEERTSIPGSQSFKENGEMKVGAGVDKVAGESEERQVCFIVNARSENMVLDVEGGQRHPGAQVIVWHRKSLSEGILNQLWYADPRTSTIRTCLNDFCLDVVDGRLVVNPCDLNKTSQKWSFTNNRIQNVFSLKWVIGLKKSEIGDCDLVYGSAEDELVNVGWIPRTVNLQPSPELLHPPSTSCCTFNHRPGCRYVIICDNCDKRVKGVRYKCGFCPNFDLCAACEAKEGVHDPTHILLKLNVPAEEAQLSYSTLEPLLTKNIFGCGVDPNELTTRCREFVKKTMDRGQLVPTSCGHEEKNQWKDTCHRSMEATVLFDKVSQGGDSIRPGSQLVKQWVMQNTGPSAWTSQVKVLAVQSDPNVGYSVTTEPACLSGLPPEGVVSIAVTATAPKDGGTYLSTWRLNDGKEFFGQSLEFVFTVSPESTATQTTRAADQLSEDVKMTYSAGELDQEEGLFQDMWSGKHLTVEDLLSAENNPREIKTASLTVPSNTPLADTPPRTPMVMEASEPGMVASHSDGTADASSTADSRDFVNMTVMADLVHKKMFNLINTDDYDYVDEDNESDSSKCSDDFYIVPVPDCFNPNLPPRKEASTTVVVKKSSGSRGCCSYKSVDDLLRTSSCLASAPLLSPKDCFSTGSVGNDPPEQDNSQMDEDVSDLGEEGEAKPYVSAIEVESEILSSDKDLVHVAVELADREDGAQPETAPVADENCNTAVDMNQNETDRYIIEDNEPRVVHESTEEQQTSSSHQEPEHDADRDGRASAEEDNFTSGVEASTLKLMSTVFSFVAKTAKDVFHTLQDKNSYIPPRSDWTPSQNQWTPPANTWIPPPQPAWSPSATQWTPQTTPSSDLVARGPSSPMDQLIDMGFADRQLNQQLLQTCDNDVETVVQKLVEMNGNIR